MLSAAESFVTMIGQSDRTLQWRISIDVPEYDSPVFEASEIDIDAAMKTDQPDQSRLIEGYTTAQATFTLAGLVDKTDETKTVAWLVGRYSTTSPLWGLDLHGRSVTIDLDGYPDDCEGVPVSVRKFTGTIDTYRQTSDGRVQFTCLDTRNTLRSVAQTPPVITAKPWSAGLTAEHPMNELLRRATAGAISSWPPAPPNCVLAVGGRTSMWPEVGSLDTANYTWTVPSFARCVHGSGFTNGVIQYNLDSAISGDVVIRFEATGSTGQAYAYAAFDNAPSVSVIAQLTVNYNVGTVTAAIQVGAGTVTYTVSGVAAGDHQCAARFALGATTWTVTVRIDGAEHTSAALAYPSGANGSALFGRGAIVASGDGVIAAVRISQESAPTWDDTFTPKAILDPSLSPLQAIPGYSGDPFQVIQQMAAAENGFAGFDEDGETFRFLNRDTLAAFNVAATVTSEKDLASLSVESSAASVINRAQIGFTPWGFASKRSTVYSPEIPRSIPPKGTLTLRVKLDTYAVDIDTAPTVLPANATDGNGGPADATKSWYRASKDRNGVDEYDGNLSWEFDQPAPDRLTVNITNPSSGRVWFVIPSTSTEADMAAGNPSLWIAGRAVTQQDEETADYQYPAADYVWPDGRKGAAGSRFGEVAYQDTGNPWSQDPDAADDRARDIVLAQWTPKPNLLDVAIRPNPLLQRADLIRIIDDSNTGVDEYALLFGWKISYRVNDDDTVDFGMTIDARTVASPRAWIAGVAGRSEAGVTTYAVPA